MNGNTDNMDGHGRSKKFKRRRNDDEEEGGTVCACE